MAGAMIDKATTSVEGWQPFETEKLEIRLPETYVGGDPRRDLRGAIERSAQLGLVYESLSKRVEAPKNEEQFRRSFADKLSKGAPKRTSNVEWHFWAMDVDVALMEPDVESVEGRRNPTAAVLLESVGLLRRREALPVYLSKNVKDVRSQMGATLIEQAIAGLGPYEAGRAVLEVSSKKPRLFGRVTPGLRMLVYAIKGHAGFWQLQFMAGIDDWDSLLPTFEQCASTLRLKEIDAVLSTNR